MAYTPKSGSRMAQARYDAASKREDTLVKKGWPSPSLGTSSTSHSKEYLAYLDSVNTRVKAARGLKRNPVGSGKKK